MVLVLLHFKERQSHQQALKKYQGLLMGPARALGYVLLLACIGHQYKRMSRQKRSCA